ncbi:hypothetical protein HUT19_21340 [Streptomyces sp. NA02950]|uniref:hypothetical protein n=1 Tax=Streptomyces sp. NA02950 TaxID=2742137 RepID=UPI001590B2B7|nr:hypothetical protein [Streptomyces sp. NA02950]QKV93986.1 hypothetical protein HUT19_21340 [Streptomyces sp. NA02950]
MYLRTRGVPRSLDYGFLNSAPEERWWDRYADVTAVERPCLLAVAEDGRWRVLISGIPSVRTDSVGTLICYTLVLEGESGGGSDEAVAAALASRWLADLAAAPDGRGTLSDVLDGVCPTADVDRLLAARPHELLPEREEFTDRLRAALSAVTGAEPEGSGEPSARRWIAGRSAPGAPAAFLARLSALLAGKENGQAHLLNLVSAAEDVAELTSGRLAVLVEGGLVGDAAMPLEELTGRAGELAYDAPKAKGRSAVVPAALTALLLLLLLLLAGALWIWPGPF